MQSNKWKKVFIGAIIVGGAVSLFASSYPDGLEKIAQMQGFFGKGRQLVAGVMPDYQIPGVLIESIAKSLAGMIGTSIVFVLLLAAGKFLYRIDTGGKNR